jgi:hypothetical protein
MEREIPLTTLFLSPIIPRVFVAEIAGVTVQVASNHIVELEGLTVRKMTRLISQVLTPTFQVGPL